MVAIVDPHIKKTDDFRVYKDANDKEIITKKQDKTSNFEGWCWTGNSVWVDFFNPKSWSWWTDMFSFKVWTVSVSTYLGVAKGPRLIRGWVSLAETGF
jgi:alpha 1,3-glucosidase